MNIKLTSLIFTLLFCFVGILKTGGDEKKYVVTRSNGENYAISSTNEEFLDPDDHIYRIPPDGHNCSVKDMVTAYKNPSKDEGCDNMCCSCMTTCTFMSFGGMVILSLYCALFFDHNICM